MQLINSGRYIQNNGHIEISADPKTDYFIDSLYKIRNINAPFLFQEITGNFIISCSVEPEFHEMYDAGGIFIYDNDECWIKQEFEKTDLGYQSIVSVVANGT